MSTKEIAKKIGAVILFLAALIALLGGYLAFHAEKNSIFIVLGIALGIVFIAAASALANIK